MIYFIIFLLAQLFPQYHSASDYFNPTRYNHIVQVLHSGSRQDILDTMDFWSDDRTSDLTKLCENADEPSQYCFLRPYYPLFKLAFDSGGELREKKKSEYLKFYQEKKSITIPKYWERVNQLLYLGTNYNTYQQRKFDSIRDMIGTSNIAQLLRFEWGNSANLRNLREDCDAFPDYKYCFLRAYQDLFNSYFNQAGELIKTEAALSQFYKDTITRYESNYKSLFESKDWTRTLHLLYKPNSKEVVTQSGLDGFHAMIARANKEELLRYNWNNSVLAGNSSFSHYFQLFSEHVNSTGQLVQSREDYVNFQKQIIVQGISDVSIWKKITWLFYFNSSDEKKFEAIDSMVKRANMQELQGFDWNGIDLKEFPYRDAFKSACVDEFSYKYCHLHAYYVLFTDFFSSGVLNSIGLNYFSMYQDFYTKMFNYDMFSCQIWKEMNLVVRFGTSNLKEFRDQVKNKSDDFSYYIEEFGKYNEYAIAGCTDKCDTNQITPAFQGFYHVIIGRIFEIAFSKFTDFMHSENMEGLKSFVEKNLTTIFTENSISLVHEIDDVQNLLFLFSSGAGNRYKEAFHLFDGFITQIYMSRILLSLDSIVPGDITKIDLLKKWLHNEILYYVRPLCTGGSWSICDLNYVYDIFHGARLNEFKQQMDGLLDDTPLNRITLSFFAKYTAHKTELEYMKPFFMHLEGYITKTYLLHLHSLIKAHNPAQLFALVKGFFKYISLEILHQICENSPKWNMCRLRSFYALIASKAALDNDWGGNIISIHDVERVNVQKKIDDLVQKRDKFDIIASIRETANTIASQIDGNHDEVISTFGNSFSTLGDYFYQTAVIDVGTVSKTVRISKERSTELLREISIKIRPLIRLLNDVVTGTFTTLADDIAITVADIILKTSELVETIANNANPIKLAFGGTNFSKAAFLIKDIALLIAKLAKIAAKIAKVASFVSTIQTVVEGLESKLNALKAMQAKNSRLLIVIQNLANNDFTSERDMQVFSENFLGIYQSLKAPLSDSDISDLEISTSGMIAYMCDIVNDSEGALSMLTTASCGRLSSENPKFYARLHEVFKELTTQFEKLGGLARNVVGLKSAKKISDYAKGLVDGVAITNFDVIEYVTLSNLYADIEIEGAALQFCIFHKYRNGKTPSICRGDISYSSAKILELQSYVPHTLIETTVYPRIPTWEEKYEEGGSTKFYPFVNLTALENGENVTFALPRNHEWLRKYGWINNDDLPTTVSYVKSFELFLPLILKEPRRLDAPELAVRTKVTSGMVQSLRIGDSTQYSISNRIYEYHYTMGYSRCGSTRVVTNPYHETAQCIRPERQSHACIQTYGRAQHTQSIFPSLLTEWTIHASYDKAAEYKMVRPAEGMKMELLAVVQLQQSRSEQQSNRLRRERRRLSQLSNTCRCADNEHLTKSPTGSRECTPCPASKSNALNGYTCQE